MILLANLWAYSLFTWATRTFTYAKKVFLDAARLRLLKILPTSGCMGKAYCNVVCDERLLSISHTQPKATPMPDLSQQVWSDTLNTKNLILHKLVNFIIHIIYHKNCCKHRQAIFFFTYLIKGDFSFQNSGVTGTFMD